jgi:sec-independent protein translocase protein TatA
MLNPLIGMPQGMEWIIILAIVVLVFGAAKLPDLARSSGQALRIFKTETRSLREDDAKDDADSEPREIAAEPTAADETVREQRGDTTA